MIGKINTMTRTGTLVAFKAISVGSPFYANGGFWLKVDTLTAVGLNVVNAKTISVVLTKKRDYALHDLVEQVEVEFHSEQ